jgi:hypothetical protein
MLLPSLLCIRIGISSAEAEAEKWRSKERTHSSLCCRFGEANAAERR